MTVDRDILQGWNHIFKLSWVRQWQSKCRGKILLVDGGRQSGLGSELSIIIEGKRGERREGRGERGEVGFDGTGQVRLKGQQPGSETN